MGKDKLRKFAEFLDFEFCFNFPYDLKGNWHKFFKNNNPIVLELGCGKGEYTVALAQHFNNKNFIGLDLKSNRMWRGAKTASELKLTNVAFIRTVIEKVNLFFEPNEADEIWITFPDPFPKDKHAKHRLTHPRFLMLYKQILNSNGKIRFKTDDDGLFNFTLEVLEKLGVEPILVEHEVYNSIKVEPFVKDIKTHYEKLFSARGRTIKYCEFYLPAEQKIQEYLTIEAKEKLDKKND